MMLGQQRRGMRERESQIERDVAVDVEPGIDGAGQSADREESDDGVISSRVPMTGRSLLVALVLSVAGVFLFGLIPLLPFSTLLGIAGAGFAYGLGTDTQRYLEMAIAGALAGGGSMLLGNLLLVTIASGTTLFGFALLSGVISGVVGHYFGRDLRAGLTRDLHEE